MLRICNRFGTPLKRGTRTQRSRQCKKSSSSCLTVTLLLACSCMSFDSYASSVILFADDKVMPSKSKPLKKLLHFYWEICPKTNPDGKLKQEMILVWYVPPVMVDNSNAIRNDLQHPNEYVCGMTLRFLCKLQEPELLEPLLPPCRACLVYSPFSTV